MTERQKVLEILLECIQDYAEQARLSVTADEGTVLLGPGAALDSLGLVMVVADFESRLNEAFDAELVLASEQAMSLSQSPFRSVAALAGYAEGLLATRGTP
jgi:acyl carrier protein